MTVPDLIMGCGHDEETRDLMKDEFISELVPFLPKLNGMQWQSVLSQMREMTTRPRRTV